MYVDECHSGKYVRYLLRDPYRQDGKVRHRTMANLSSCSSAEIQAIKIVQETTRWWCDLDAMVREGLEALKTLCLKELRIHGKPLCHCLPKPRASVRKLLEKAQVLMPEALPHRGVHVATRKKLPIRRKHR